MTSWEIRSSDVLGLLVKGASCLLGMDMLPREHFLWYQLCVLHTVWRHKNIHSVCQSVLPGSNLSEHPIPDHSTTQSPDQHPGTRDGRVVQKGRWTPPHMCKAHWPGRLRHATVITDFWPQDTKFRFSASVRSWSMPSHFHCNEGPAGSMILQ